MIRSALKFRFVLIAPYLAVVVPLLIRAYFFDDHSSMFLGASDVLLLFLLSPWIFLFSAIINYLVIEGNLVANLAMYMSVVINAAGLYYLGWKFEHAPNNSDRSGGSAL
jgi:hypothetical protein